MNFPALDAFAIDPVVTRITWRVYMQLQRGLLDFTSVREVRIASLVETLKMRPASVIFGLNQLAGRGYLLEHERGPQNTRRFTLAWTVAGPDAPHVRTAPTDMRDDVRLATGSLRWFILERDGHRCLGCGASVHSGASLHVDHIIPWSRGGRTEPSNLRSLCEACNIGKGDSLPATPTEREEQ